MSGTDQVNKKREPRDDADGGGLCGYVPGPPYRSTLACILDAAVSEHNGDVAEFPKSIDVGLLWRRSRLRRTSGQHAQQRDS